MRCDVAYEVGRLVREFTRSSRTILSSDSSDHSKHHRSERSVRARAQHSVTACAQGVQSSNGNVDWEKRLRSYVRLL